MLVIPSDFTSGPFARRVALDAGISARVLEGVQFIRDHTGVYHHRSHEMSFADRVAAARLALPADARTTGITRLQELGVDFGPRGLLHFVVQGDHHLVLDDVFLHRTVKSPPTDDDGTLVEAAWVAYCAEARTIDAIKVGCALRAGDLLALDLLHQILTEEPWRRGVKEAAWAAAHLDGRCLSFPEAEVVTMISYAGLPAPEVNVPLRLGEHVTITPDLWYATWRCAVEYEGGQHQTDRDQYTADIDRYATYRRHEADYLQITKELLRLPKETVRRVHRLLVEGGYTGPAPDFEGIWTTLFMALRDVVRARGPQQR